ncbi:MAG: protein-disulfide reductase DsbD N-terminal domain-containing protein [Cytophagales bacterium]|nr:protein-disulfide reductase DsbD N-terminal domain-containing protein [Cytophagales bacterium]
MMRFQLRYILLIQVLFWYSIMVSGQILNPATWSYQVSKDEVHKGDVVELIFRIELDDTWYIYSNDFDAEIGPTPTEINFEPHQSYELVGELIPLNTKEKYDNILDATYRYMDKKAVFKQKVKILGEHPLIKGDYTYLVCSIADGKCIPGDGEFEFTGLTVLPK